MATIQKRGNSYKITVSCGYDLTGKQIRRHKTFTPDKGMTEKQVEKAVQREAVLFEERCRRGQILDENIRFADFAEKWFTDYAEKQLRPKTLARYRSLMPRINAAIGHIRLSKLQPHHLMAFYDNLAEAGVREDTKYHCKVDLKVLLKARSMTKSALAGQSEVSLFVLNSITQNKNISKDSAQRISKALNLPCGELFDPVGKDETLSPKTILHHHRLLSSILSTAVQWQVIFSNPCERIKPPKVDQKEPHYLDETEAAHLLELLQKEEIQNRTMISILLYTGVRRGELLGLEWEDIDFENHTIHIRRSSLYLVDKGIFVDETKNATSVRVIKAPDAAFEVLRSFKKWQAEQKLKVGDQWKGKNRLFTTWDGRPLHPDTLTGWFHDFIVENDLPQVSIHSLRHTNATLMIAGGTPVTTVANRLGHATPATTTKIYAHAIRSADEAAAETLQNILAPSANRHRMG